MVFVAPMLGVAAGLGAFTAYDWWWAALLASVGVIAGAGIGFGRAVDDPVCRHLRDSGVLGDGRSDLRGHRDRDSLRHRHRPPVRRARGRRGIPPVPASGRERGDRVRRRLGWRRGDRCGTGLDRAVLGSGADSHTGALHPDRKARPDPGKRPSVRRSGLPRRYPWRSSIRQQVLGAVAAIAFVLAFTLAKYWLMYGLYTFSVVLFLASPAKLATSRGTRRRDPRRNWAPRRRAVRHSCVRRMARRPRPTARARANSLIHVAISQDHRLGQR